LIGLILSLFGKRKSAASVYPEGCRSDEALYARFAEGDERAFNVLLDRHGDRVLGYLTRFFGDREMATDLTQEAFLKLVSAAQDFRGQCSFSTFLFRIVRNLAIDVMRSRASRPDSGAASLDQSRDEDGEGPTLGETVAGSAPSGELRTLSGELSAALSAALVQLPPEQREVFLMREVEDLKFGEIAEVLRVNENTVKSRMHYAVMSLRQALAGFRGAG